MNLRIGQGYDVHRLVTGRPLILGGIPIPHPLGLDGHSDADVLLHAITDALLGAAALGDIGRHFPDTSAEFKNANSGLLLQQVAKLIQDKGWTIVNVDSTVIAQKPKLAPHIEKIRENVANLLNLETHQVNVKAKTNEKLGFEGQEQGIVAQAVVLLVAS